MAASTPVRTLHGWDGSATTDYQLALTVFSGQVLEAFRAKTKFWDNTGNIMAVKQLDGGRTAQWPIIGDDIDLFSTSTGGVTKGYHTPGDELLGQDIKMSEATITVDDVLVAQVDVPFADLDLNHFDVIQPYAVKLGRSLAIDLDKKCAAVALTSARTAAVANIHAGGNRVSTDSSSASALSDYYSNDSTGSGRFRDNAADLARLMDEDNVPEDGRNLFIGPYIRMVLRHEGSVWGAAGSSSVLLPGPAGNPFSKDTNSAPWDLNNRVIGTLEGFNVILTNHIPSSNVTGHTFTKYNVTCDGSSTDGDRLAAVALCGAQEGAAGIGMVQASGLRTVIQDDERRNTKFMKAQIMVGIDKLAPWRAGTIGIF